MTAGLKSHDRLAEASALLSRFVEDSLELRAGAIFGPDGLQLFATDEADWTEPMAEIWRLAGTPDREVSYVHVGTEGGDVLAVSDPNGAAVVTSNRFPLASLVLSDLRAVLRELDPVAGKRGSA
jgi:hypothetical protein